MSKELNLFHFSVGDAMREEIKSATEFGKKVSSYVAKGKHPTYQYK
jgi:adenylate kinase family enzyme